jgi:hypothetical protein
MYEYDVDDEGDPEESTKPKRPRKKPANPKRKANKLVFTKEEYKVRKHSYYKYLGNTYVPGLLCVVVVGSCGCRLSFIDLLSPASCLLLDHPLTTPRKSGGDPSAHDRRRAPPD